MVLRNQERINESSKESGPNAPMKVRRWTLNVKKKYQDQYKLYFPRNLPFTSTFDFGLESQPTHFHGHFGARILHY